MKVALVSPYDIAYPGGVSEHTLALTRWLGRRGHSATIFAACSYAYAFQSPHLHPVAGTVLRIPIGGTEARIGVPLLGYVRLRMAFRQNRYDVVHLQEPLVPGLNWWALMQAAGLPKTVTVGTFHAKS
jgi:phosphatidylinositol alpha-mannosyltransferase